MLFKLYPQRDLAGKGMSFGMTHCLIQVNICTKLFQNPLMDERGYGTDTKYTHTWLIFDLQVKS